MNLNFTNPDLSGKAVLVTGGGTGLGRAAALAYAKLGAGVWITGRRLHPLEEVASLSAGSSPDAPPMRVVSLDVCDRAGLEKLATEIRSVAGALHCLVNNAAILGPIGSLAAIDPDEVRAVWDINIHGTYLPTAVMLDLLRADGAAVVINVSSGVGRQGRGGWGPYSGSKFAIEGLTQCWADDLAADGISVVAVSSKTTATTMRAAAKPEEDPATLPQPEDIVPAFVFPLSNEARTQKVSGASIDARDFLKL